jgi:hypothetical protein
MSFPANYPTLLGDALGSTGAGIDLMNSLVAPFYDPANAVYTAAGNFVMGAGQKIAVVNKGAGAATQVTLPVPVKGVQQLAIVKDGKGDGNTNNITIIPDGVVATTIDGQANAVIKLNYGSAVFFYNGTEWNALIADFSSNDNLVVPGAFIANGIITPAAFVAATVDDYNPAGLATCSQMRLTPNAAGTTLDGIVAQPNGTEINLFNIGTVDSITLAHQAAGSAAANRFRTPNQLSVVIRKDGAVCIIYDTASTAWRVMQP